MKKRRRIRGRGYRRQQEINTKREEESEEGEGRNQEEEVSEKTRKENKRRERSRKEGLKRRKGIYERTGREDEILMRRRTKRGRNGNERGTDKNTNR